MHGHRTVVRRVKETYSSINSQVLVLMLMLVGDVSGLRVVNRCCCCD